MNLRRRSLIRKRSLTRSYHSLVQGTEILRSNKKPHHAPLTRPGNPHQSAYAGCSNGFHVMGNVFTRHAVPACSRPLRTPLRYSRFTAKPSILTSVHTPEHPRLPLTSARDVLLNQPVSSSNENTSSSEYMREDAEQERKL